MCCSPWGHEELDMTEQLTTTKEAKGLYSESRKILMQEIGDDTNRWKDITCFGIGRINIMKMTILPKAIYRVNAFFIK